MTMRASIAAVACALGAGLAFAPAAVAAPHLVKAGDFDAPVYAAGAPGDNSRLFVVEQQGTIRIARNGKTHQDILVAWLIGIGYMIADEMRVLIEEGC